MTAAEVTNTKICIKVPWGISSSKPLSWVINRFILKYNKIKLQILEPEGLENDSMVSVKS